MRMEKRNELGMLYVPNTLISRIIYGGMKLPECAEKIWPATPRGRQIGIVPGLNDNEFAMYISAVMNDIGEIRLEFSVIVRFGTSIKLMTKVLSDYVADNIMDDFECERLEITINIAGVKSRRKAKRNIKVIHRYEKNESRQWHGRV